MNVEFKLFADFPQLKHGSEDSAGYDIRVFESKTIYPGFTEKFSTKMAIFIGDPGVVGIIHPRSSLGLKSLMLANTTGVIDSDYQGEIAVYLRNVGNDAVFVEGGDRVAQILFIPVIHPTFTKVDEFSAATGRGTGGWGSTGGK